MSHLGDNHLLCVAGEHCGGKLDAKEKATFSFKYLLVYSFRVEHRRRSLPEWATCQFFMQCANFG